MKLIEVVIKRVEINKVKTALQKIGVEGISIEEIVNNQFAMRNYKKGRSMFYRSAEYIADFIEKIKVDIVAADELAGKVIETVVKITDMGCILSERVREANCGK